MRNLKKIVAVICVVAMMASIAIVPALAAGFTYETEATTLNTLGLMAGMNLGDEVTRIQGLTFAIKAAGNDAAAQALTDAEVTTILANVTDAADIPAWGLKYAAYAVKTGLTTGVDASVAPKVKFAPLQGVSGDSMLVWILKSMGYTDAGTATAWETSVTTAKVLSLTQGYTFHGKTTLIRDDVAGILFGAAKNGVNKDGKTFIQSLIDAKFITEAAAAAAGLVTVAPAKLAVVSAKADSLTKVVVTFNQALPDKDTAEDEANYTIDGVTIDKAELQADGKTVILTTDPVERLDNDTDYTLEVGSDIVDQSVDFTAYDFTVPTAESIELTGPSTFTITFSEPIDSTSAFDVSIDDGVYSGTVTGDDSKVVTVDMGVASLDEGNYEVVFSGAKDFAGYTAPKKTFTLAYKTNNAVPTATITDIDRTSVELTFNVAVQDQDGNDLTNVDYFYHSYSSYHPDSVTVDGKVITLHFDTNPLPEGNVKIVIKHDGVSDQDIESVWGVAMGGDQILTAEVVDDTVAPTITNTKVDNDSTVILTFSEGLDVATAEDTDNYVVKDKDGKEIDTAFTATYNSDDNTVTLDFAEALSGNYTVTVEGVTDDALNANEIKAITLPFTVTDTTGIDLTDITVSAIDGTSDTLIVRFPEDMIGTGAYSVLSKDNYQISVDGSAYAGLADKDTIAFFGGNDAVKITIKDGTKYDFAGADADTIKLLVGRLADAAGNKSDLLSTEIIGSLAEGIDASTAIMKTYKTVEITYPDTVVTAAPVSAFVVTYDNGVDPAVTKAPAGVTIKHDADSGDSILTLTLQTGNQLAKSTYTDLPDNFLNIEVVADKVKFDTGVYANAQAAVTVTDGIAPKIDTIAQTAANEITVTLTEDVALASLDLAATDFVLKDKDGKTLVPTVDYAITAPAADEILITLIGDKEDYEGKLTVDTVDAPRYISDANGEETKLAAYGDAKTITADVTAPTVVKMTENSTAKVITVKFSEAMDEDAVETIGNWTFTPAVAGVAIDTITYSDTTKSATITLDGAALEGDTLAVANVTDAGGNAIVGVTGTRDDGAAGSGVWTVE